MYILRRLFYVLPIVFGVSVVTFLLFDLMPGNPALSKAGKYASQAEIERLEEQLGLSGTMAERYAFFFRQMVTLDFGKSFATDTPVLEMFLRGIPHSLALAAPAFFGSVVFSVIFALLIAFYRGKLIDHLMLGICIFLMSISALSFIIGAQYFFAFKLSWFPVHGFEEGWAQVQYLVLPVLIWIALTLGPNIRLYRTVFLEEVSKDYVRTAQAKGLPPYKVLFKHVLKNAMIPIITNEIIAIPYLITGTFLLENFFGIPGVGDMLITAIPSNDYPIIKAYVVVISILFILFNLLSDILYSVVDPRVRLS